MTDTAIRSIQPLGFPWRTLDPFLFCAHHLDLYPAGNAQLGPVTGTAGRNLGSDFSRQDGWSMYHGDTVPGFPKHPHRGFETISIARQGLIDHADSLGASARFGNGDVQWMTAGNGVVHSEMFPLLNQDGPNTVELLQLWLNLPAKSKRVQAHFSMIWDKDVPTVQLDNGTEISVIAGEYNGTCAAPPPPDSWAADPTSNVVIWLLTVPAGAAVELPVGPASTNRALYIYEGQGVAINGVDIANYSMVELAADQPTEVINTSEPARYLVLQGTPIGEPVVHHGPFVMNTQAEIQETMREYGRTGFGQWNFATVAPVHAVDRGRFAFHADGTLEEP